MSLTVQCSALLTDLTSSSASGSAQATRLDTPSRPLSTVSGSSGSASAWPISRAISTPSLASTAASVGSR